MSTFSTLARPAGRRRGPYLQAARVAPMCTAKEQERPGQQSAGECVHPLAMDEFNGRFGLQLRRMSCLICRHGWWESDGTVIGSTRALGAVARLAGGPRPTGWAAADREWRKLADEGLAPLR
jgi:hypothetical protein